MSVRILLADDHRIMRQGLRALLEKEADVEVSGEAEEGRTAVQLARKLKPDVVVMDVGMPDLNGIEATRQIKAEAPAAKVLALSMHADKRFVERMLTAGASGYVLKDDAFEELVGAIRTVAANKIYLSPGIAGAVVEDFVRYSRTAESTGRIILTPRQREVLQLLAEGKTTKQIASLLYVSRKTVETHRRQIMEKLDIHSIAELTKYAVREGLTSIDS